MTEKRGLAAVVTAASQESAMVRSRILIGTTLACLLALLVVPAQATGQRVVVGILPAYDASAEQITERLAPNLAFFLYQALQKDPHVTPVLMSPGGLYDPDGEDWIESYSGKTKVDVVLISRILPSTKVNDRTQRLNFEVQLLDLATGKRGEKQVNSAVQVTTAQLFSGASTTYVSSSYSDFYGNPVEFAKQPLGKATLKLADWAKDYTTTTLTTLQTAGTGAEPSTATASCAMNFRIRYSSRHSASKSYSLLVNDKDESGVIADGVAAFTMQQGALVARFQVNDAPYRMPTEKLYQVSTSLDCASATHTLVVELGSAGEALLHWE